MNNDDISHFSTIPASFAIKSNAYFLTHQYLIINNSQSQRALSVSVRTVLWIYFASRRNCGLLPITENSNIPGLLLLIDFEKAFDSLAWSFIFEVLKIQTYYTNIKSCVFVNGKPSSWFNVQRGWRQGYPLSPYIFVICAEILAILIRQNDKYVVLTLMVNNF